MTFSLTSSKLIMPMVMSAVIGVSTSVPENASWWEHLLEKWGIAAVMGFGLFWAVKKIDASDKSRIELSQQMLINQTTSHKILEEMLVENIQSRNDGTAAINALVEELKSRPCAAGSNIVGLSRPPKTQTHQK